MKKEYWCKKGRFGAFETQWNFELRTNITLQLIEHFGAIAAKIAGESSDGRAKMTLQEPQELVDRCFAIADAFVARAEERGEVRLEDNRNDAEKEGVA